MKLFTLEMCVERRIDWLLKINLLKQVVKNVDEKPHRLVVTPRGGE